MPLQFDQLSTGPLPLKGAVGETRRGLCGRLPGIEGDAWHDFDEVMTQCVKDPKHRDRLHIATQLAETLTKKQYQFVWYQKATAGTSKPVELHNDLSLIEALGDELRINYDSGRGHLRLRAVAPHEATNRGGSYSLPGEQPVGSKFQGIWFGPDGYGCIEFRFDQSGEASGLWGFKTGNLDSRACLRTQNRGCF